MHRHRQPRRARQSRHWCAMQISIAARIDSFNISFNEWTSHCQRRPHSRGCGVRPRQPERARQSDRCPEPPNSQQIPVRAPRRMNAKVNDRSDLPVSRAHHHRLLESCVGEPTWLSDKRWVRFAPPHRFDIASSGLSAIRSITAARHSPQISTRHNTSRSPLEVRQC